MPFPLYKRNCSWDAYHFCLYRCPPDGDDDGHRTLNLVQKGKGQMGWQPMAHMMRAPSKNGKKNKTSTSNGRTADDGDDHMDGFIPFSVEAVANLAKEYSLCVGGEALAELIETGKDAGTVPTLVCMCRVSAHCL